MVLAGMVLMLATLSGCANNRCGKNDWCACNGGTECYQSCADVDGCRFFCWDMEQCGATCGNGCNFEFRDATNASVVTGDDSNVICHDSTTCGAICGARCNYTCYGTDRCALSVGPDSNVGCNDVKSCVVECKGACTVSCQDQVDSCEVTCAEGASPITCPNGDLACGGSC